MLGILIPYASFYTFEELQKKNIEQFVKCPHKIYILHTEVQSCPSQGHMNSINHLLSVAWKECDSFLLFDNDMIFLEEFTEPEEDCWYWSQERNGFEYAWPNLFYFKKHSSLKEFSFANGSDSGGSTWTYLKETENKKQITADMEGFDEYRIPFIKLCEEHQQRVCFERYFLNGCSIFHFRAMSNWCNLPQEFCKQKEQLVMDCVRKKLTAMT